MVRIMRMVLRGCRYCSPRGRDPLTYTSGRRRILNQHPTNVRRQAQKSDLGPALRPRQARAAAPVSQVLPAWILNNDRLRGHDEAGKIVADKIHYEEFKTMDKLNLKEEI